MKDALREVAEEVVRLLAEEGLLSIEEIYTDGTKIEANANKYTFVWKKAIQTKKEKIKMQLKRICQYAQSVSDANQYIVNYTLIPQLYPFILPTFRAFFLRQKHRQLMRDAVSIRTTLY